MITHKARFRLNFLDELIDFIFQVKPYLFLSIVLHFMVFLLIYFSIPAVTLTDHNNQEGVVVMDLVKLEDINNLQIASSKDTGKLYSKDSELVAPAAEKQAANGEEISIQKPVKKKPVVAHKTNKTDSLKLQSALKAVKNTAKEVPINYDAKEQQGTIGKGKVAYNKLKPQTINMITSVRSQIVRCWNIPHGARNIENTRVKINMKLNENGQVLNASILDTKQYKQDPVFRAIADSALRAVYKCSPLQGLPKAQYHLWNEIDLVFDPKEMLK